MVMPITGSVARAADGVIGVTLSRDWRIGGSTTGGGVGRQVESKPRKATSGLEQFQLWRRFLPSRRLALAVAQQLALDVLKEGRGRQTANLATP